MKKSLKILLVCIPVIFIFQLHLFSQPVGLELSKKSSEIKMNIPGKDIGEDKLLKSDSNRDPIVNETPGLPDWTEKDIEDLKKEIQVTLVSLDALLQKDSGEKMTREIEYTLGNYIGQALVRSIDINDALNIFDKEIITENVSRSALDYLHYYENEKYFMLTLQKEVYTPTHYSQTVLDFIYHYGGLPEKLLEIENENSKSTPSGEYTMYYSALGMTLLTGATTIWVGLIPWNDYSSDKAIGFDFYFYRGDNPEANDSVRVSTNGYMTMFQKGAGALDGIDATNDAITSTIDPDGYLAPWWDDLIIKSQGDQDKVSYKTEGSVGSRVFTVEYYSVTRDGGATDDYHNFQIKLYEGTNLIAFRYGSWNPDTDDNATVGIENYTGVDGDCGFSCTNTISAQPALNVNLMTSTPGYWTGETSTNWLTASNWDDNNVPDGNTDVVIPSGCPNYPVISGQLYINSPVVNTYECNSFRINSGAIASTTGVSSSVISRGEMVVNGQLDIGNDLDLSTGSLTTLNGTITTGLYSGQYGISNLYDGAVFNLESGNLYVEGIIVDTLATFNGNGGAVHIYIEGYTLPVQEVYIYSEDVFFNYFYVDGGVNAELKRGLLVNEVTRLYGSLDIHGSLASYGLIVWSGGELIINPLCSVSINNATFKDGSSLVMFSTGPPVPFASYLNCATNMGFDPGSSTNCTSGAWINVGGYLDDEGGSFFGNTRFTGTSNSYILGYPSFRSLVIEKTGSTVYYASDDIISVSDYLYISSGSFNPDGYTVEVDGSWYNNVGDIGFEEGIGTVVFTAGDDVSYISGETFYNLVIDGTTDVEAGSTLEVRNDIEINSEITINENSTILIGNSLAVNGGGILNFNGAPDNEILCSDNTGYYDFNIYFGGEISASHTVFEHMSATGIKINNGATIQEPFNNCTFRQGISSGTLLTINNNQNVTIDGACFPVNTWGGSYNVNKSVASGQVNFTAAAGGFAGEAFEYDPNNLINWSLLTLSLNLKAYLEGPFNGTDMNTTLNGVLPSSHPFYPALPYFGNNLPDWYYTGPGSVGAIPNANVVDWVLIELRDAVSAASANKASMIDQMPGFILNNGSIVSLDGASNLQFSSIIADNLFIVVYNRNHESIMNAFPPSFSGGTYSFDYTSAASQVYGGTAGHKELASGKWGMRSGDGNGDGDILPNDKSQVWGIPGQIGKTGYLPSDNNFDRQTNNKDKNDKWFPNLGTSSQVPD